jgi:hypothetical protein
MKKILLTLITVFIAAGLSAQAPQTFKYQTVVRNTSNAILDNTDVYFRISILQGSSTGTEVYKETFSLKTNDFGLAAFNIGQGTVESGSFAAISWSSYEFWVKVELDPDAAGSAVYEEVGTSQLLSVPYALSAKVADNAYWEKNGNDISYGDGKVGIGIATPTAKLDLRGTLYAAGTAPFGTFTFVETTDSHADVHESILTVQNLSGDISSQANIKFDAGPGGHGKAIISGAYDGSDENGKLTFKVRNGTTSYADALTLRTSGNVGINETNPDSKLHVNGDAHVTGDITVDGKITIPAPVNNTDAVNKEFVDALISKITGLVLWNRLGSESEVLNSEFGEDGSLLGTAHAYEPGKYGNGYVRKDVNSYIKFPKSVLQDLRSRGTVELWVNPKVTNPVAFSYGAFMIIGYGIDNANAHVFIRWGDGTTGKGINGGVNFAGSIVSTPNEASQFVGTIGVPFHLAVVWDVLGIDGTNQTVRMYRDGVMIGSNTTTWDDQATTDYDYFWLGTSPDAGGYDKFITDNIKVWNYAKTNFSDRYHE